jgi:hypothetical protein
MSQDLIRMPQVVRIPRLLTDEEIASVHDLYARRQGMKPTCPRRQEPYCTFLSCTTITPAAHRLCTARPPRYRGRPSHAWLSRSLAGELGSAGRNAANQAAAYHTGVWETSYLNTDAAFAAELPGLRAKLIAAATAVDERHWGLLRRATHPVAPR